MNYVAGVPVELPFYRNARLRKMYVPQAANRSLLDMTLAWHCAPVLLGKKPAALFPQPTWWDALLPGKTAAGNLRFVTLRRNETGLVFAYCPRLLSCALESGEACKTLGALGYPVEAKDSGERAARCLAFLERRFRESGDFPHEVGFFLGYPPLDVLGFMRHRGSRCKLCGVWKVYSDVPRAAALFAEYAKCRERLVRHVQNGGGLKCGLSLAFCLWQNATLGSAPGYPGCHRGR